MYVPGPGAFRASLEISEVAENEIKVIDNFPKINEFFKISFKPYGIFRVFPLPFL